MGRKSTLRSPNAGGGSIDLALPTLAPDLDLKAPANVRDPFPLYAWLREHEPIHRSASLAAWVVTRYADVVAIFEQPARFSSDRFRKIGERYASERSAVQAVAAVLRDWLVFRDPPDHTRLRALLQKSFTPRQLEKGTPRIQATIDALLDPLAERGEADFVRDFAFPLPARVIALLLGAPPDAIEPIKRASDRLAAYLGGATDGRDNFAEASAGVAWLVEYFGRLLAERRARPRDDLMSLMLAAEHEGGRLGESEVVANCVLLLFAGHETTTNLLGNGLFHLLGRPDQLAQLRARPELVPSAVEELLRFDGPVPATLKIASEDVAWAGLRNPPGRHGAADDRLREPRRAAVSSCGGARRRAFTEPSPGFRLRHPLLPRRAARAPGGAARAREPAAALRPHRAGAKGPAVGNRRSSCVGSQRSRCASRRDNASAASGFGVE